MAAGVGLKGIEAVVWYVVEASQAVDAAPRGVPRVTRRWPCAGSACGALAGAGLGTMSHRGRDGGTIPARGAMSGSQKGDRGGRGKGKGRESGGRRPVDDRG